MSSVLRVTRSLSSLRVGMSRVLYSSYVSVLGLKDGWTPVLEDMLIHVA